MHNVKVCCNFWPPSMKSLIYLSGSRPKKDMHGELSHFFENPLLLGKISSMTEEQLGKKQILTTKLTQITKRLFKAYDNQSLSTKRKLAFIFAIIEPKKYLRTKLNYRHFIKRSAETIFKVDEEIGFAKVKLPDYLVKEVVYSTKKIKETRSSAVNDKPYLRAISDISDYSIDSPEMNLATNSGVLRSVQEYMGHAPLLYDITTLYSPPPSFISNDELAIYSGSQLFHRDGDDLKICKIWVLCSDVTMQNGPTTLINANESERIARSIDYRQETKIPLKKELTLNIQASKLNYAVGEVGTTYVTDTVRLLHYGSRTSNESDRLVLMLHYVSFYSCYFRRFSPRGRQNNLHPSVTSYSTNAIQKIALRGYLN